MSEAKEILDALEEAHKDSERLDWVEKEKADIYREPDKDEDGNDYGMLRPWHVGVEKERYWNESLREAIDAARATKPTEPGR